MSELDFIHRFVPATKPGLPTLLMLHGTGGDENDLLPLGRTLLPGAALLSPRGKVQEQGMNRFFRRLAPGVFDLEDVKRRVDELAQFVDSAAEAYGFDRTRVVAVGYSNGANVGAGILLMHPRTLAGAALLHAQTPLEPEELPDLSRISVFLSGGRHDTMVPAAETERLGTVLRSAGCHVTVHWEPGGHTLTRAEIEAAFRWLATIASETEQS